jgi:hypothetical protein
MPPLSAKYRPDVVISSGSCVFNDFDNFSAFTVNHPTMRTHRFIRAIRAMQRFSSDDETTLYWSHFQKRSLANGCFHRFQAQRMAYAESNQTSMMSVLG